jgi:DNA-directed RNA polymerase specialized sigma subunit
MKEKMKNSLDLRNRLALENKKSSQTIDRWIARFSVNLQTKMNLQIISEELNISVEEVRESLKKGQENGIPSA